VSGPLYAVPDGREATRIGRADYTLEEAVDALDSAVHILPHLHPGSRFTVALHVTIEPA
jgi:hypothetical protein